MQSLLFVFLTSFWGICNSCERDDICILTATDFGENKPNRECDHFMKLSMTKQRIYPRCGWDGTDLLVCCPSEPTETIIVKKEVVSVTEMCERLNESGVSRIIGGIASLIGEFPHFAQLGYREEYEDDNEILHFNCGGSLISPNFVLTAAHCSKSSQRPVVVRFGMIRNE